jgi:hypothetical protein
VEEEEEVPAGSTTEMNLIPPKRTTCQHLDETQHAHDDHQHALGRLTSPVGWRQSWSVRCLRMGRNRWWWLGKRRGRTEGVR